MSWVRWAAMAWVVARVAIAGGPSTVAWLPIDRWPEGLPSRAAFDAASRAELLSLAAVLAVTPAPEDGPARWLREEQARVVTAYAAASAAPCTWDTLVARAKAAKQDEVDQKFWSAWVGEQVRLARLFPRPTSEVFPLRSSDLTGAAMPDLTFALTFDDGPTPLGGTTDLTLDTLRSYGLPATFFVQGERLAPRKDSRAVYAGFCVASHGEHHVAHTATEEAIASVTSTNAQLALSVEHPRVDLFRPPYGQRGEVFAGWLEAHGVRSVLWNIDSQDWRSNAQAEQVAGRVMALMLAQRKGVILFHDVHPVASEVVAMLRPALDRQTVRFVGCEGW